MTDLVGALQLEQIGERRFRAANMDSHQSGGVVFGGQMLGQIVAAGALSDPGKRLKSAYVLFAKPALVSEPIELALEPVQSGKTISSFDVHVFQGDKVCARGSTLLSAVEDDFIRHGATMPAVGGPETGRDPGDGFPGREARILDTAGTSEQARPEMFVWSRFPGVPDDEATNLGLLAHSTAQWMLANPMAAHEECDVSAAHGSISVAIMTHSVTFHDAALARDWHLFAFDSPYAGHGRTYGRGEAFAQDGTLVASFAQDGMIRQFDQSQAARVPSAARI
jgi:acyl-CoA thioesterase-2